MTQGVERDLPGAVDAQAFEDPIADASGDAAEGLIETEDAGGEVGRDIAGSVGRETGGDADLACVRVSCENEWDAEARGGDDGGGIVGQRDGERGGIGRGCIERGGDEVFGVIEPDDVEFGVWPRPLGDVAGAAEPSDVGK